MDYVVVLLIMNLYFIVDIVNLWCEVFNVFVFEYWFVIFSFVVILV